MPLTGGTVVALAYKDGVLLASDRTAFAGGVHRLQDNTRQYRLNKHCLISFSGDFADFQWLQTTLEIRQMELKIDAGMEMKPKMVHAFLASRFYQRRSKMNPIIMTVVVCGMEPVEFEAGKKKPFIGIVDMRGNAYEVDHVATELGTFLLRQMIESRQITDLSQEEATKVVFEALKVSVTRNARSGQTFDITTVDAVDGVKFNEPININSEWDVVKVCDGTYK